MNQRLNSITNHPLYKDYYTQITELEKSRMFCKHDMTHFLDVARIGYIMILEDASAVSKEDIYTVALLHDIGRHMQYLEGIPHERASAKLCVSILVDSGYSQSEIEVYQEAILNHRNALMKNDKSLSGYLYRSDKASRPCHICPYEVDCDWPTSKKNMSIAY